MWKDVLEILAAILTIYSGIVTIFAVRQKKENDLLIGQINYWQENNTTIQRQLINIKKGDDKIIHPMGPLLKRSLRKRWLYLTVCIYFLIGYIIGFYNVDIFKQIIYVFSSTMIYRNPAFWFSIIGIIILIFLPFLTLYYMINKFPFKRMVEFKETLESK